MIAKWEAKLAALQWKQVHVTNSVFFLYDDPKCK